MNHYFIHRNNNIVLVIPKNIQNNKNFDYDCLSGSRIMDTTKKIVIGNFIFNSLLLEDYLKKTKDYRNVMNGNLFSQKELNALISFNNSAHTFIITLEENEEELKKYNNNIQLTLSNYFIERCESIIENLLSDFEIEKIKSAKDLNDIFLCYWNDLVQSMVGVLHNNPFKIIELSTKLKLQISDAYSASIDENAQLYIHECTYLQPVFVATFSLFTLFLTGLFKFECEMDFINAVYLIKPGKII
jgi:hypothetical protein